ncbi:MAG: hypothetical protein ACK5V3_10615 [Bdellovibrionales bacterium]
MLERLNDMIQERYGKGFSVRRIAAVGSTEELSTHLQNQDLLVPIIVKDVFLGYGMVHQAVDLNHEQREQISKLIRMILEPELYTEHLERTLHNLQIEKDVALESKANSNGKLIYVYGQNAHRVQKIALDIHEISQNMSYLPLLDVISQIKSINELCELDGSTLVVDLEKSLSEEAQTLLIEFIKQKMSGPLLIFTSARPAYQLAEASNLKTELIDLIKNQEFSVDRLPVDKVMLKDVLEMMYFETQT